MPRLAAAVMTAWLVLFGLVAITVGGLLLPLFQQARPARSRAECEVAMRRDQLSELQQDQARGVLSGPEAKIVELEISRQMLAAADAAAADSDTAPRPVHRANRFAAALVGLLVPLAAGTLYWAIGAPTFLDSSPDRGVTSPSMAAEHDGDTMLQSAERLARRLEQEPANQDAWVLLARTYGALKRYDLAVEAYRRAVALPGADGELYGGFAETLVFAAGGIVTPEARSFFERSLAALPGDPRSRYYLGVAAAQAGKARLAIETWLALEADSAPDAPWLPAVRQQMERTAAQAGLDLAALGAGRPGSGPTATQGRAMAGQPAEPQLDMIRGMVAGLAARLETEPQDLDGWLRLARSYYVLGEPAQARQAIERATALEKRATPSQRTTLQALRADVGKGPPAQAIRQPAAETVPRQQDEHSEMIQAMVANLARRLESDPNDPRGWRLLGRSYAALGQLRKAEAAYAEAVARDPEDLELLRSYAQVLLDGTDPARALPDRSLRILRNLLEIDDRSPDALWLVGWAERDAGNPRAAAALWRRLLAQTDPAMPRHGRIKAALDALATTP